VFKFPSANIKAEWTIECVNLCGVPRKRGPTVLKRNLRRLILSFGPVAHCPANLVKVRGPDAKRIGPVNPFKVRCARLMTKTGGVVFMRASR